MNFENPPYRNHHSINTFENKYQSSDLNPVQRDLNNIIVNIDSTFKKTGTQTNDFVYELPNTLKNIISYEVNSIEIPNTWYTISEYKKNNKFTITVTNYNDGVGIILNTTHVIQIPDGNYTLDELKTHINNYFTNVGNGLNFLIFDYNPNTQTTIFRVKNKTNGESPDPYDNTDPLYSPALSFTIVFDNANDILLLNNTNSMYHGDYINTNIGALLGFNDISYTIDITNTYSNNFTSPLQTQSYKGYLESECVYGETLDKHVFLVVEDFNNNGIESFYTSNENLGNTSNILAKIPINTSSFSNIIQSKGDYIFRTKSFYGPVNIKRLRIKLVNKFGELIDTNCRNYSFTLQFKQIYS
jgi:hypothetical protein